jgi:hypothetical protein
MPNWSGFDALAGAGVIVSTVNEMLSFIEQNLGDSAIAGSLTAIRQVQGDGETALGWHIRENKDSPIYWHNGGTGGYASVLLMDPKRKSGVVILTTSTAYGDVTELGFMQATGDTAIAENRVLSGYAGTYKIAEGFLLGIFERNGQLFGQATGQGAFPLMHSDDHEFANVAAGIRIVFSDFDGDTAQALTLYQAGRATPAPRVAAETPARQRDVIDVDAARLKEYEGQYDLAPGAVIAVEARDKQLYAQLTGQLAYPVFAYAADKFFYKVVDAQLEFERDDDGKVIAVLLHQAGQRRAPRRMIDE